jgi:hypothetical protein
MLGDIRASLYDLFGYLIPGTVIFGALCLALALTTATDTVFQIDALGRAPVAAIVLGASYILGHLGHAVGNALPALRTPATDMLLTDPDPPTQILRLATDRVAQISGADMQALSMADVLALVDEHVKMYGNSAEREMFVYREGFYRGMTISSALLGVLVLVQAFVAPVRLGGIIASTLIVGRPQLFALAGLAAIASWGFLRRMRRFGRYKVKSGLYAFVMSDAHGKIRA